jgi:hypothetical protein
MEIPVKARLASTINGKPAPIDRLGIAIFQPASFVRACPAKTTILRSGMSS